MKLRSVAMTLGLVALTMNVVLPRRAEAIAGGVASAVTGGAVLPLFVVGGIAAGGGLLATAGTAFVGLGCFLFISSEPCKAKIRTGIWTSLGVMALGVLVLDDDGVADFQAIEPEAAQAMGISTSERFAFNDEIEEVRAVGEDLGVWMGTLRPQDPVRNRAELEEKWNDLREMISPEAFSALQKIIRFSGR